MHAEKLRFSSGKCTYTEDLVAFHGPGKRTSDLRNRFRAVQTGRAKMRPLIFEYEGLVDTAIAGLLADLRERAETRTAHCLALNGRAYTPSDLSNAEFSQDELDALMADSGED